MQILNLFLFFCLRFNSRYHGLASTRMSPLWILLELRVMQVVVTTGAIRRAKLQLDYQHQQTSIQRFTGRMPFPSPNRVKALKGNVFFYH